MPEKKKKMTTLDQLMSEGQATHSSQLTFGIGASDLETQGLDPRQQDYLDFLDRQAQPEVSGAMANSSYFPDLGRPTQQGYFSGQTLRMPIYAPGGTHYPFALMSARQRALQQAALRNKAAAQAITAVPPDVDPLWQRSLNKSFFEGFDARVDNVTSKFGREGFAMLRDPGNRYGKEFQRFLSDHDVISKEINSVVDIAKDLSDKSQDPKYYVPPSATKNLKGIITAADNIQEIAYSGDGLGKLVRDLKYSASLTQILNDYYYDNLEASVMTEDIKTAISRGDFDVLEQVKKTALDPDSLNVLSEDILESNPLLRERYEAEDISRIMKSMIQDKLEKSITVARKNARRGGGGGGSDAGQKTTFFTEVQKSGLALNDQFQTIMKNNAFDPQTKARLLTDMMRNATMDGKMWLNPGIKGADTPAKGSVAMPQGVSDNFTLLGTEDLYVGEGGVNIPISSAMKGSDISAIAGKPNKVELVWADPDTKEEYSVEKMAKYPILIDRVVPMLKTEYILATKGTKANLIQSIRDAHPELSVEEAEERFYSADQKYKRASTYHDLRYAGVISGFDTKTTTAFNNLYLKSREQTTPLEPDTGDDL